MIFTNENRGLLGDNYSKMQMLFFRKYCLLSIIEVEVH